MTPLSATPRVFPIEGPYPTTTGPVRALPFSPKRFPTIRKEQANG